MKFYFAGGAREVGGSCIHVRIGDVGILFDSGIRQGSGRDPLPDFRGIQEMGGVDLILVSHAHMDHTGSLPVISKAYPLAPIYMTRMSEELTRVLLYDSLKLMERREEEIPQYSQADVVSMLNRIIPVAYQAEISIRPDIKLTMYPAGHIAGAACIYLKTPEGSIFYSGDVSGFAQRTIEGIRIPRLRPDVALLESTYGNRMHASRSLEEDRLVALAADCIAQGKKILIPTFALGRSQEVLLILRTAMANGALPKVPVYVDGMVRDINRVYTGHPTFLRNALAKRILAGNEPFYTDEIRAVKPLENRDLLLNAAGSAIFVSSSGMLSGGPSVLYAKALLPREDACIILTGYQDEEAPGRLLMNLALASAMQEETRITLDQVSLPVRCRVEMVGLSAHADQTELTGIIEKLGARRVILVHGDTEAMTDLGNVLSADPKRQVFRPKTGDALDLTIHNRRKQGESALPWTLQRSTFDGKYDVELLWDYWQQHYAGRSFSAEQAAQIWFGPSGCDADKVRALIERILDGPYFSRHPQFLYLIQANQEDVIREAKREKPVTPQQLESSFREWYPAFPLQKFSYHLAEKKIVLTVNYPDAVPEEQIEEMAARFRDTYQWEVTLRPTVNHQAAGELLRTLFGTRLMRLSYFEAEHCYRITLDSLQEVDKTLCETFLCTTGWSLQADAPQGTVQALRKEARKNAPEKTAGSVPESRSTESPSEETANSTASLSQLLLDPEAYWFYPEDPAVPKVEQNLALQLIDMALAEAPCRPYKKGIKSNHLGKYIELFFAAPAYGFRNAQEIQDAASQIGMNIHIADSVNQQEIFAYIAELCRRSGIFLQKTPSYAPVQREFRVKLAPGTMLPKELQDEFFNETGMPLRQA